MPSAVRSVEGAQARRERRMIYYSQILINPIKERRIAPGAQARSAANENL
jgi:hypothetical protein